MAGSLRESSDELVSEVLEQSLSEARGAPARVLELSRRPFPYETSFAIDELDARLADGETLELLVKDVGRAGLSDLAASAKPTFALDQEREIVVYRDLLAGSRLSTPRFVGASIAPDASRRWLFLERIGGEVLTDVGEISVWQQSAAWAAELDPALSARPRELDRLLLHRDGAWHRRWIDAALAVLSDAQPAQDGLAERLRRDRPHLLERLDALPRTFVHGELYASNVVVDRGHGETRIAPVDWELAGTGPYTLDLAALVSGWSSENRLSMCQAFHDSLPPGSALATGIEPLLEATSLCQLSLALQWIGWAPGWNPPESHRRDWPAEAALLLDEVGLP
jgi:hypothetical protein